MQTRETDKSSLEGIFASKYVWLFKWALQFTQNDAVAAEDLVQETFVRILMLKNAIYDLNNIEPLLYTHLKYAYLTSRRQAYNNKFQSLETLNFDTLAISLRSTNSVEQVEVQNELYKVLTYILWRRRAAKFANIFLLRFFHGYFPEEIAALCIITRHAVDLAISRATTELRAYLETPEKIHIAGRGDAPLSKQRKVSIPSHDFAASILNAIYASRLGTCPGDEAMARAYSALNQKPLDNTTLSHIASCKHCLERAARHCDVPPPSGRSMEDSLHSIRRTAKSKSTPASHQEIVARIKANRDRRRTELQEHYPTGLAIALNSQVVSVRDISSPRAILKVETSAASQTEYVEIFSEQGVLLFAMPILSHPPVALPQIRYAIPLSGDRTLTATTSFTCDGLQLVVEYYDPHYQTSYSEAGCELPRLDPDSNTQIELAEELSEQEAPSQKHLLLRLWDRLLFNQRRAFAAAFVAIAICGFTMLLVVHPWQHQNSEELIQKTRDAEHAMQAEHKHGVIHQRLQFKTTAGSLQREIYRDIEGRRQPKAKAVNADEKFLSAKLAEASIDWNDPLSATSFDNWRRLQLHAQDTVATATAGLVTIAMDSSSTPQLRQSITIRLPDYHVVARSIVLNQDERIDIAELSYELSPWSSSLDALFEPLDLKTTTPRHQDTILPTVKRETVTADQLDIAELSVRIALQDLNANAERIIVQRGQQKILVSGIVDTDTRKEQLRNRLATIPHSEAQILSYHDLESLPERPYPATSIAAANTISGASAWDNYCAALHYTKAICDHRAVLILDASATISREAIQLNSIKELYPPGKSLTPEASRLLAALTKGHALHLLNAIELEESVITSTENPSKLNAIQHAQHDIPLNELVHKNLALSEQLVYTGHDPNSSPKEIIENLDRLLQQIRFTVAPDTASTDANSISSAHSNLHTN